MILFAIYVKARRYKGVNAPMSLHEFAKKEPRSEIVVERPNPDPHLACARLVSCTIEYTPVMCFYKKGEIWRLGSAGELCM